MLNPRKGILTKYRDVLFRSILESQWAAFFDSIEWPWRYEPIELPGYIPDFVLPFQDGRAPMLVEVKPELSLEALRQYVPKIQRGGWTGNVLVLGCHPFLPGMNGGEFLGLTNDASEPGDFGYACFGMCAAGNTIKHYGFRSE